MLTTERFDVLILKQIVNMGDTIAKQLIIRGYGTEASVMLLESRISHDWLVVVVRLCCLLG